MAHSPHRRWKGCQLCKGYKFRDAGQAHRQPAATLRKIGKTRRITRHDLGDQTTRPGSIERDATYLEWRRARRYSAWSPTTPRANTTPRGQHRPVDH